MFWNKRKKNEISYKYLHFNEVINFVNFIISKETDKANQKILLDYILSVVKTDLISEYIADVFYKSEVREWNSIFPMVYYNEYGEEIHLHENNKIKHVDLGKNNVIVLPWNRDRMVDAIKNVFRNKFRYISNNHMAMYFTEMDLCYVYNGIHSITAGVILKNGVIEAKEIDISQTFKHIRADEKNWYNSHTGEVLLEMCDFRLGVMYEIAKIRHKL